MLKNQTVNHVSEHLSAICPVYTTQRVFTGYRLPYLVINQSMIAIRDPSVN